MKEITLTEFKRLSMPEVLAGPCLKVTANMEALGYFIVNPQGIMRDRVEGICGQIDAGRGLKA